MENPSSDIKTPEERRRELIENYREFMPDIEDRVYSRQKVGSDFSSLYAEYRLKYLKVKFMDLSRCIIDIRNNSDVTSYDSNTVCKTDNKYSNETKKMIKILLSKGFNTNQTLYELEKVYGSGILTQQECLEERPLGQTLMIFGGYGFQLMVYTTLFYLVYGRLKPSIFKFWKKKRK
jgi:hypothetical protein